MDLLLATGNTKMRVNDDLSLSVFDRKDRPLWETSRRLTPAATVRASDGELWTLPLSAARDRKAINDTVRRAIRQNILDFCARVLVT